MAKMFAEAVVEQGAADGETVRQLAAALDASADRERCRVVGNLEVFALQDSFGRPVMRVEAEVAKGL